ncbi:MAG: hypothetical protein JXO72_15385 [Vicinamibacteria bacterium]|nr:hypothetical protein [Vicinamibacteria bacterium]
MPFAYYDRLSETNKRIYRRSDAVTEIPLPDAERLRPVIPLLREALAREERRAIEAAAQILCRGVAELTGARAPQVQVLAVRPELRFGELHGLYTVDSGRIQVWMRTLRHRRVVAFRTFLRTLLHELTHHLDYALLKLSDSFHTEGFFKRESSLFRQLVPETDDESTRKSRRVSIRAGGGLRHDESKDARPRRRGRTQGGRA